MILRHLNALPDCVRHRPPLYHPDFPFILLWSQKSGCTTVVKWFFAQIGLLEEALAYSGWVHDYEGEVFKRRKGYRQEVAAALRARSHRVIKVVRDPHLRAPSAFLVLAERGAVITHRRHWTQAHWDLVDEWLAARGKDPAHGIAFMDHLAMVDEYEMRAAQSINPHLSPQYVRGEEEFLDEVVPIERFADWTARAGAAHGLKTVDMATLGDSRHHHATTPQRTAALGDQPERVPIARGAYADGRFPESRAFLNARSLPAIRETYRQDIAAYGHHYPAPPV